MKKLIVLVVVLILVGSVLIAATPAPSLRTQTLQGSLRWEKRNVCGVSDYVSNEAMTNIFLTGNFAPTNGQFVGCRVTATGTYYQASSCNYFKVSAYQVVCPTQ